MVIYYDRLRQAAVTETIVRCYVFALSVFRYVYTVAEIPVVHEHDNFISTFFFYPA